MGFDDAWSRAAGVPGWLTRDQAQVLWESCGRLSPGGVALEIGSHEGRSTLVLGAATAEAGGRLTAVDPFHPAWRYGARGTEQRLRSRLADAGLSGTVEVVVGRSTELRHRWSGPLDLVYVDGGHDYWTVRDDLRWAEHLPTGGRLLIHDAFSSFGVTVAVLAHVLPARRLAFVARTGSLAVLESRPPTLAERIRILGELPWFCRNLVVKVLLRIRARPLARLLGHHDDADPY